MIDRTYDDFEDELDAIRIQIYEKIKDMTPEEEVAYINKQAEPIIKKLGLRVSTLKPVQPRKRERVGSDR